MALLLIGTLMELVLLGHFEDAWQMVPLVILASAILCFTGLYFTLHRLLLQAYKLIMTAAMFSGVLGVWFHLEANYEFETEMYPKLGGFELLSEMLSGAIPALAPGSMVAVGLVGWLYVLEKPNQHE